MDNTMQYNEYEQIDEQLEEELRGPGFYRLTDDDELDHAPNFVYARDYELLFEHKDTYNYPVHGWIWAEDELTAAAILRGE